MHNIWRFNEVTKRNRNLWWSYELVKKLGMVQLAVVHYYDCQSRTNNLIVSILTVANWVCTLSRTQE